MPFQLMTLPTSAPRANRSRRTTGDAERKRRGRMGTLPKRSSRPVRRRNRLRRRTQKTPSHCIPCIAFHAPAGFSPPQLDKEHHGDVNPAPVEQSPRYNEITEWFLDRHKASLSRGSVHGRLASGPHGNYGGRLFLSAVPLCEDDGTFIISGSHPLDAPVPRVADVWDCPPDRMARQVVGLVPPYQATPRGMSRRRLEGGLEIPCRNRKPIRRPRNAFA